MLRKTLTILSLIGLLLSVGLWGMGSLYAFGYMSESYIVVVQDSSVIIDAFARGGPTADDFGVHWRRQSTPEDSLIRLGDDERLLLRMPQYVKFMRGVWALILPLWIPTVAFAIGSFSFILIPICRRRKRKNLGLCLKCGYDLRGLVEQRCPECGQEFEKQ